MNLKDLNLLKENLPDFPGIHGRERLFNSAVLIPLIIKNDELHFIFEKRAEGIRQGGEICFPGGAYELQHDNSCKDTALRETSEELGIPAKNITMIGQMNTVIAAMGAAIEPFIGIIENISPEDFNIQKNEVKKIFSVPVSWFLENNPEIYNVVLEIKPYEEDEKGARKILLPAKELGLPKRYHNSWGHFKHRVLVYRVQGERIWGLTAEIVNAFINLSPNTKKS
ncbi:MAG: coenzyme A pyrophosphatase [Gammaproteobacteria bacterium]|nr:MAG: coenzyme A pyrophosphatase [Deltaproteobacteria bacterium]PIE48130.1 MAG: coenzyme A pyrophosphatase [Gammaproteobacteria bacterium]